jgi:hypothetical protein
MSYSSYGSNAATWQERLEGRVVPYFIAPNSLANDPLEKCREAQIHPPVFQIVSDRRGMLSISLLWSTMTLG